ncbi:MAG TPA: SIS domain-containing protein [Candidatus Methylomirabilis sp.]|nr:SIS domain-containing protein [Candidatus Methylomirabilis sp.]
MTGPERRAMHPYHMHDAILTQPGWVTEVLAANAPQLDGAADLLGQQQHLILCGIGTSFHAALVGEHLVRQIAVDQPFAQAVHSFDFVLYPPAIRPGTGVLVVSHRGTKNYSLQALFRANEQKAPSVTITGRDSAEGIRKARILMATTDQEVSSAHTKSYTASLSLLAALAVRMGRRAGRDVAAADAQLAELPTVMRRALEAEAQVREIARLLAGKEFLAFVGGGPNAATAYEVALKMKETNYTPCEGFQVEQFLHGPLAGLSDRMAVWAIAPPGPSYQRCLDVVGAANAIGATTIALVQEGEQKLARSASHAIALPALAEALSPLVYVIPLQLFCYHLALEKGTNPDTFHLDDPRHQEAKLHYNL